MLKDLPEIGNDLSKSGQSEIGALIGRKLVKMENGVSEVTFDIPNSFLNLQGVLHGGAFATMLDTACGAAVRSSLDMDAYSSHATIELKTSYLKGGAPGFYRAVGRVVRLGKSIAFADADLFDAHEELVGCASATFKLRRRK